MVAAASDTAPAIVVAAGVTAQSPVEVHRLAVGAQKPASAGVVQVATRGGATLVGCAAAVGCAVEEAEEDGGGEGVV